MAINFPNSPSNGATHTAAGQTFTYDGTAGVWNPPAAGNAAITTDGSTPSLASGITGAEVRTLIGAGESAARTAVYANIAALPTSGTAGDMAYVTATNRLYIWNGTGWYNIALINTNPTISGVSSSYSLAQDGTATTVTITAADPEGLPITYSIASDTSGSIATVAQGTGASTNVFTITPSTSNANAGTFTLTFRASDGVNIATAPAEFSLAFQVVNSHYTSALITSVGANNAVNNSFDDKSTSNHTITAAGDATQTTFSPYRHGGYSLYFPGAVMMDLGFSTLTSGNWTFECWAKISVGGVLLGKYGGGNQLEAFGISTSTGYMYTHTGAGVEAPTCNNDLRDGSWHYLVWERNNGTYYYWADGSLEASFANTETPGGGANWQLGGGQSHGGFTGNIKEARLSLTTAVYSGSAPTTPTEAQTAAKSTDAFFTGVGLEVKDYSSNNRTFTPPATLELQATAPYDYETYSATNHGGSVYLDGTGDSISAASSADFGFGTGDFSIEWWTYFDAISNYPYQIDMRSADNDTGLALFTRTNLGNELGVYVSASVIASGTYSFKPGIWTHYAICKTGGYLKGYMNGVEDFSITCTRDYGSSKAIRIGSVYGNGNYHVNGNMADVRIVKGTATRTGNFTPPTAPLTAITNTKLLVQSTDAGIIDKSQTTKKVQLFADTKSSTAQYKFLSSSIYFDGTGDYLKTPSSGNFLAEGPWTQEMWLRLSGTGTGQQIGPSFGGGVGGWNSSNGHQFLVFTHSSGFLVQYYGTNNSHNTITLPSVSTLFTPNTWHHWAISWDGTTLRFFVDGTSVHTTTTFTPNTMTGTHTELGRQPDNSYYSQAYYSDVRITKGLARYTSNFTAPTAALQG